MLHSPEEDNAQEDVSRPRRGRRHRRPRRRRLRAKAFETLARYAKGDKIGAWVVNTDRFFDKANAAQLIGDAY